MTHHSAHNRPGFFPFFIAILVILVLVVGWHFLLPVLGLTIAITAGVWAILIATVTILCVAMALFFIFRGALLLIIALFALLWALLAVVFVPIIFPIVLPIVVILLLLGTLLRKRQS